MIFVDSNKVVEIIQKSADGRNTRFLSASHSLWFRFKNYEKCPPMALEVDGEPVCLIFATFNRDGYANLYEIVTIQGKEGNGYASRCWENWIQYAFNEKKMTRLKLSCTPSSVSWHMRNGLIFWAVDPSGSLRSDQALLPSRIEQIRYRDNVLANPENFLPPKKVCDQFLNEGLDSYSWGAKKKEKTQAAIDSVGKFWLRESLLNSSGNNLEQFF